MCAVAAHSQGLDSRLSAGATPLDVPFSRRNDTGGMVRSCTWRGGNQERVVTRTAGLVAPCSVLGREAVVACTAEAPWKVPWRSPFLVGGFL